MATTSALLHAANPATYRHTNSNSMPSTVRSVDALRFQRSKEKERDALEDVLNINTVMLYFYFSSTFCLHSPPPLFFGKMHVKIWCRSVFFVIFQVSVGHLRNGSTSAVLWMLWICCCFTVSGLNRWQLGFSKYKEAC